MAKACAVACARWSSASLAAGGVSSHCHTGLWPYMQKNGDTPVVSEAWLLAAGSARGSQADQSTRARKHRPIAALMRSVWPSDSGWNAVVRRRSIPSRLNIRCQNATANWAHGPKTSSRANRGGGRHGGQISRPDWRRPGAEGHGNCGEKGGCPRSSKRMARPVGHGVDRRVKAGKRSSGSGDCFQAEKGG